MKLKTSHYFPDLSKQLGGGCRVRDNPHPESERGDPMFFTERQGEVAELSVRAEWSYIQSEYSQGVWTAAATKCSY